MFKRKDRKKVLIIEDDPALRQMYIDRLLAARFEVVETDNGEDAIDLALLESPDLILLDILLPRKGGLGVLQVIKTHPVTQNIPVLVLTNYPMYEEQSKRIGAAKFFIKSQTLPKDIIIAINEILKPREIT
jgi:CheY-like chemotaxis protein